MEKRNRLQIVLYLAAGVLATILGFKFVLPLVLPFLIGALIAKLVDPAVRFLIRKGGMPRWVCSGVSVSAFYLLLGSGVYLLCRRIGVELAEFFRQLPELLSSLAAPMTHLHEWLSQLAERAPDGLGTALEGWVDRLFSGSAGWVDKLNDKVFTLASAFLAALPSAVLFLVASVLSSFLISSQLPDLGKWLKSHTPAKYRSKLAPVTERLKRAFGGWCIAQLKLMGITFCIVTAGLFFIGLDYALLFGLLIAFIDALPVFGSGTILIPWGLLMFLRGQTSCGIGLLILYGVATLTRTALEPKIVGRQIGLNPLLTLLALYTGYRLMGIGGMILFPIGALLLRQLWDSYRRAEPA